MKPKKLLATPLPVAASPRTNEQKREALKRIVQECVAIAQLQADIKRMSMTYQRSAKEVVASHYNLPFEQVDLPYPEWAALREKYENETGRQL